MEFAVRRSEKLMDELKSMTEEERLEAYAQAVAALMDIYSEAGLTEDQLCEVLEREAEMSRTNQIVAEMR